MEHIEHPDVVSLFLSPDRGEEIDHFGNLVLEVAGEVPDVSLSIEPLRDVELLDQGVEVLGDSQKRIDLAFEVTEDLKINQIRFEVPCWDIHLNVVEGHVVAEHIDHTIVPGEDLLLHLELHSEEGVSVGRHITEVHQVALALNNAELLLLL